MNSDFFNVIETELCGVHVFYADVSELNLNKEYKDISEYRKNKIKTLRKDKDKRLSLGVELLLIHALKKCGVSVEAPLDIITDEHGKPKIKGRKDICFNLAHAQNVAVCAIADRCVGVDIERIDRISGKIADKYFSLRERECDFCFIWTRKEAVTKAEGSGIALGIDSFDVTDDTVVINNISYSIESIKPQISGYYISLCVQSGAADN